MMNRIILIIFKCTGIHAKVARCYFFITIFTCLDDDMLADVIKIHVVRFLVFFYYFFISFKEQALNVKMRPSKELLCS